MPLVEKRFQTVDEGFAYIESFTNLERTTNSTIRNYRLDRMRSLLEFFDNPQRTLRLLHIAGTKGKGSTGLYLASILSEAGYRTGFYASPHVSSYTERITDAGAPFEDALYIEMINRIASRLVSFPRSTLPARSNPTTFELLTLLGLLTFREAGCHWAVIETGIGGRLDATNVITPEACLLTPVEREHTDILGTTLAQIAGEKAGIIKPGVPVFSGYQHPEVRTVFETAAAAMRAPIRFLDDAVVHSETLLRPDGGVVEITWRDGPVETYELGMPGEVQGENSALAVLAAKSLFSGGDQSRPAIDSESIHRGLRRARLPGRMEVVFPPVRKDTDLLDRRAPIVLDAAHTPVSVSRLLGSFRKMFPVPAVLIFGSVLGKDPAGMAEILAPHFSHVIISTPGSFKKSDPKEVWNHFVGHNPGARLVPDPRLALAEALRVSGGHLPILVTGSFYMVAEIRRFLTGKEEDGSGAIR